MKDFLDMTLSEGIGTYNQNYLPDEIGIEKDTNFSVFAKDEKGKVLGCKLITAAENFTKDKGFGYMRTEILRFQARPFYEKLGYKVFGELSDYPKGHTTYCLVKALY